MQRVEASYLRRNFFRTLKHLAEPIEISRNGRVDALLVPPPAEARDKKLQFEPKRLARICQKHGIKRLALFGSVARDDFRPDSDVDVLIELLPQRKIRLKSHVCVVEALTDLFGREVDMHYFEDLARADAETRKSIERDLKVIYAV